MVGIEDHRSAVSQSDRLLGVVGNLARYHREHGEYYAEAAMGVGSQMMERKMLRTIKQLAETLEGPR